MERAQKEQHYFSKKKFELHLQEYVEIFQIDKGGKCMIGRGNSMCKLQRGGTKHNTFKIR